MAGNGKKTGMNMAGGPSMDHDYQAEDDHRTMMHAAEIQDDDKRMAGVKRHQRKQTKALARVGSMVGGHSMMKGGR